LGAGRKKGLSQKKPENGLGRGIDEIGEGNTGGNGMVGENIGRIDV
jgi:hypothetical protein